MRITAFAAALLLAATAQAAEPKSDIQFMLLVTGNETSVGVLTSTGTSVTNASTAVPFSFVAGEIYMFVCDAKVYAGPGSTAHATYTNANFKPVRAAETAWFWTAQSTTYAVISASGTANCAVFRMGR